MKHKQATFTKVNNDWAVVVSGENKTGDEVTVRKSSGELSRVTLVAIVKSVDQHKMAWSFTAGWSTNQVRVDALIAAK